MTTIGAPMFSYFGHAYAPPMSEEERTVSRWVQEAKTEALVISKANSHLSALVTVEASPWGVAVTGNLAGNRRRMELTWPHIQHRGLSPIRDTVRNIANVLGLRSAG